MLPARHSERMRLADVLPACLDAIADGDGPFAAHPVRRAVVVVVDGLGAEALATRAGHARTAFRPEKTANAPVANDSELLKATISVGLDPTK